MSAACPEYGFDVAFRLAPDLADHARHEIFLAIDAIARNRGLTSEGGGGPMIWRFTITRDGGQAIDADREVFATWAATRPEIVECTLGPLADLAGRPRGGVPLELLSGVIPLP